MSFYIFLVCRNIFYNLCNKKRKFEEIDWYEFMKYNNLKPRITFIFENATEDDLKKLEKLIKPYYNEKEISIILESNS